MTPATISSFKLALRAVTDRRMAMHTTRRLSARRVVPEDVVDQVVVALNTVFFQDFQTHGPKADWLGKVLQRETLGVPETVLRLYEIFGDGGMWDMAIVASRDGVMTRVLPAVVLIPHDVAVDA